MAKGVEERPRRQNGEEAEKIKERTGTEEDDEERERESGIEKEGRKKKK